jgi:multiple sugar transport system substrate-binding protein
MKMSDNRLRVWLMSLSTNSRTLQFYMDFYEKHIKPGTKLDIEWTLIPWNAAWNEYANSFKSGRGPDVFQVGSTWLGALAQLGFLDEVPGGFNDKKMIAPWLKDVLVYKGKPIAAAWTVEINLLYARKDIVNRIGLQPGEITDWKKLQDACRRIAVNSGAGTGVDPMKPIPYAMGCRPDMSTLHQAVNWLRGAGWRMPDLSVSGCPILDTDEVKLALSYVNELYRTSLYYEEFARTSPYIIAQQFFQDGRFAFLIDYTNPILSNVLNKQNNSTVIRYPVDIIPIPAGPHGYGCRGGASVLCVNSNSSNREAAWELVKYLSGDVFLEDLSLEAGHIPAFDCNFWQRYANEPAVQSVRDMIGRSFTYPAHSLLRSAEIILSRGLSELLWHMIEYGNFDGRASEIAQKADLEISRLIELSWGI